MQKRVESVEATRQRITEAAVALHEEVGPAATTISAVAERAGVQRITVYRHFLNEPALIQACNAHWEAAHPAPDPASWRGIADPPQRLRHALAELYAYYRAGAPMLEMVLRDLAAMPEDVARSFSEFDAAMIEALEAGAHLRGRAKQRRVAVLGHVLGFATWRSLTLERGLKDDEAVDVSARWVECA
jgi:AcrR family transcriptional regulator